MTLPDTKLLIFGDPRSGTPLMIAAPSIALDLPLKILVAQEGDSGVVISYNNPEYLLERHELPEELMRNISAIEALAKAASTESPASAGLH